MKGRSAPSSRLATLVHAFPHQPRRALRAGVAELDPDLRGRCSCGRSRPIVRTPIRAQVVQARATGGDPPSRDTQNHLGPSPVPPRPAPAAQVHEMKIADGPSSDVYMSMAETITRCPGRARAAGSERTAWTARGRRRTSGRRLRRTRDPELQVAVRHAALRVSRLNANWGGSCRMTAPMFSNHSRLACAARCASRRPAVARFRKPQALRPLWGSRAGMRPGQRILHRELGSRPDREVSRVGRVADEQHISVAPR